MQRKPEYLRDRRHGGSIALYARYALPWLLIAGAVSLCIGAPATQPAAGAEWSSVVNAFADAVVRTDGSQAIRELFSDGIEIRQFNRARREGLAQLREKLNGTTLLSTHSYLATPETMASDVAADVKDNSDVSDALKRLLVPADDAAMKRANIIATKWIASSLFTSGAEPVGVLVLLTPDDKDSTRDDSQTIRSLTFVLLRGEFTDGHFRIRQICYGDPVMMAATTAGNVAGAGN